MSEWKNIVVYAAILAGLFVIADMPEAEASQPPECEHLLEYIPRNASTISVSDPWITRTGDLSFVHSSPFDWSMLHPDDYPDEPETVEETWDTAGHEGYRLVDSGPGEYLWDIMHLYGEDSYGFTIDGAAGSDTTSPTLTGSSVTAEEEFDPQEEPMAELVIHYRYWTLEFPRGEDDLAAAENLRYLVEVSDPGDMLSGTVLVTPTVEQAGEDRIQIRFGGNGYDCLPPLPFGRVEESTEVVVRVRAVDLAGNVSDDVATGQTTLNPRPPNQESRRFGGPGSGCQSMAPVDQSPHYLILLAMVALVALRRR